jgi:hypothetical protein
LSESCPEAVKTPGIAAGNILFVPNTCSVLRVSSKSLFVLCVAAIAAIGCGNAGPGLEDSARNISRRSSELMAGRASEESYAAATEADEEEEDTDLAEDEMAEDEMGADESEGSEEEAPPPPVGALISDDSPLCGNGVLNVGELCDITIKEGEGMCPTECEQPDACHAGKLVVKSCWTQCVPGELVDCSDDV